MAQSGDDFEKDETDGTVDALRVSESIIAALASRLAIRWTKLISLVPRQTENSDRSAQR